jgi:hypothetical protein
VSARERGEGVRRSREEGKQAGTQVRRRFGNATPPRLLGPSASCALPNATMLPFCLLYKDRCKRLTLELSTSESGLLRGQCCPSHELAVSRYTGRRADERFNLLASWRDRRWEDEEWVHIALDW